jgi:hypothetical protein
MHLLIQIKLINRLRLLAWVCALESSGSGWRTLEGSREAERMRKNHSELLLRLSVFYSYSFSAGIAKRGCMNYYSGCKFSLR